jgi:hypothetical protein
MALSVVTKSGKPFRRCGILFGAEPVIVPDKILAQQFDTPKVRPKSPTIKQVLKSEEMLICSEAK